MRPRLALPAAVLLCCALAGAGAAPVAADPVDEQAAEPNTVTVAIDSVSPVAPKPGDTVRISGTATNTGSTTLSGTQAIACIDRNRLTSRADLAQIPVEDPPTDSHCTTVVGEGTTAFDELTEVMPPGTKDRFTLTVPWDQWRIDRTDGAYVVGVRVNGNAPDGTRVFGAGRARTLLPVMDPASPRRVVRTALTVPVLHRPTLLAGDIFTSEQLADSLAPSGRLGRILTAAVGKNVTLLVDPSVLEEARRLAAGYQVLKPDGSKVRGGYGRYATAWLAMLDRVRDSGSVVLLPFGDPDVRALTDGGADELVDHARELAATTPGPGGRTAPTAVWLENGAANAATIGAATADLGSGAGAVTTLLSSWSWPPADRPKLLPAPVVGVTGDAGATRAVVSDAALTAGGPDKATAATPLQLRQRFAAETALIALDDPRRVGKPGPPVTVVAALPRGSAPDGSAVGGLVQGLALPWIQPVKLADVTGTATATPPPAVKPWTPALAPGQVQAVRAIDSALQTYDALLSSTEATVPGLAKSRARAASLSWRGWSAESDRFRGFQQRLLDSQFARVRILEAKMVTLSGSDGRFPLTIANDLDQPVRVGLAIESLNRDDLEVEPVETLVVEPNQRQTFFVRASAQANGLIKARAHLVTPDGRPLNRSLDFDIRAAQYGAVGWILVASAVALLFGTSAIRIYRRVRAERRAHPPAGTDTADPSDDPTAAPAATESSTAPAATGSTGATGATGG